VWRGSDEQALRVEELEVAEGPAPDHICAALELPSGSPAWARSRRYLLDRREVMLSVSWLPADVATAPGALEEDPGPGGLYARLAEAGHAPVRFREDVRARLAAPHEAERLALTAGAAVLAVERVAYSETRPVEVTELVCDSAAYVLRYDLPVEPKARRRSSSARAAR
jgi:GntR family transcriptional regulator